MDRDLIQRIIHLREAGNFARRQDGRIAVLEATRTNPTLGHRCEIRENITEGELDRYLPNTDYSLRVYFLHQRDSRSPLSISEEMMQSLMQVHDISLDFLDVVSCFRRRTSNEDQGYSAPIRRAHHVNKYEIAYGYKFPERRMNIEGDDPWSIRQLGVYHQFDAVSNRSITIVLCPRSSSSVIDAVKQSLATWTDKVDNLQNPKTMHRILLDHSVRGWLEYMRFYESKIDQHFNDLVVVSDTILPEHVKFEQIANLRSIEDKCLPLRSIYDHLARVLKCLKGLDMEVPQAPSNARSPIAEAQFRIAMENFEHQLSGFMENAALLLTKITSVSQFLSDTLTFKQNQLVLQLTHLSVNDSAAVRVITILTLIYLPATAVATILDMPFFSDEPVWKVSPRIWIFFAISVPLTLLTLVLAAYWGWTSFDVRRARDTESDLEAGRSLQYGYGTVELQNLSKKVTLMRSTRMGTESG